MKKTKNGFGLKFKIKYYTLSAVRDVFDAIAVTAHKYHIHWLKYLAYSAECWCFHQIMELLFKTGEIEYEEK